MKIIVKDKAKIIIALFAVTFVCLALIASTAMSSSLRYDINKINNQIANQQWSQRNLEAKIKSANTLTNLENEALQLGLVYPTFNEIVYLGEEEEQEPVHDFALALRETAYR